MCRCYSINQLLKENTLLVICGGGIFFSFLFFGIIQEKITKGDYGHGDKFTFIQMLVAFQCIFSIIYAKTVLIYRKYSNSVQNKNQDDTPWFLYVSCATTYVFSMVSSNSSLRYVDYPTKVIGKACKPIAVLVLGYLWANKTYTKVKIACVSMIVVGIAIFSYDPSKGQGNLKSIETEYGQILLAISLLLDGFTTAIQEKMRSQKHRPTEFRLMFNMNLYSSFIVTTAAVYSGDAFNFIQFIKVYPTTMILILVYCFFGSVGQHFIFLTIVEFGPLTCSIISTTRKFFTILCSVIIFRNPMSLLKWMSTIIVFTGLGLDTYFGKKK